jgi:hypothetical protein
MVFELPKRFAGVAGINCLLDLDDEPEVLMCNMEVDLGVNTPARRIGFYECGVRVR